MKQNKKYSLMLLLTTVCIGFGILHAQNKQNPGMKVQEISMCKWGLSDGLPYMEAPGVNLGVTSFEVISENKIAFLSNASNEIIITEKSNGKVVKKFPVSFAPRDFVFDKGSFYVLDEQYVVVYNEEGKLLNKISFPGSYLGVERLARFNNETYLLLPSGNSLKIESSRQYEGWVTSSGNFVSTKLNGDNSYSFKVLTAAGKSFEKTIKTDKTVAGVYVVGATDSRIFLDVQTYISESPVSVERKIVAVEFSASGLGNIVTSIKVPDCYYVLSNNDFHVSATGSVLNMVTTPQGVFTFSLTEAKAANAKGYPAALVATQYHFNDHLISAETK